MPQRLSPPPLLHITTLTTGCLVTFLVLSCPVLLLTDANISLITGLATGSLLKHRQHVCECQIEAQRSRQQCALATYRLSYVRMSSTLFTVFTFPVQRVSVIILVTI